MAETPEIPRALGRPGDVVAGSRVAGWRKPPFESLLAELQERAVTDMTEEELAAFVSDEIHAHRREKRQMRRGNG